MRNCEWYEASLPTQQQNPAAIAQAANARGLIMSEREATKFSEQTRIDDRGFALVTKHGLNDLRDKLRLGENSAPPTIKPVAFEDLRPALAMGRYT